MLIGEDTKVQKRGISHGGKQEQPRRADLELTSAQKEAEAMQAGACRKKGRVVQSRRPARRRWLPSRTAPSEEDEILRSPNPTPPRHRLREMGREGKNPQRAAEERQTDPSRPHRQRRRCAAQAGPENPRAVSVHPLLCTCRPLSSEALTRLPL